MYVENANGTSRWSKPYSYSSWLAYWEAYKGKANCCQATDCSYKGDLVGAHVRKAYSSDQRLYIVPLCSACNQRKDVFAVPDDALLPVPSNL